MASTYRQASSPRQHRARRLLRNVAARAGAVALGVLLGTASHAAWAEFQQFSRFAERAVDARLEAARSGLRYSYGDRFCGDGNTQHYYASDSSIVIATRTAHDNGVQRWIDSAIVVLRRERSRNAAAGSSDEMRIALVWNRTLRRARTALYQREGRNVLIIVGDSMQHVLDVLRIENGDRSKLDR